MDHVRADLTCLKHGGRCNAHCGSHGIEIQAGIYRRGLMALVPQALTDDDHARASARLPTAQRPTKVMDADIMQSSAFKNAEPRLTLPAEVAQTGVRA